jgi:hypothetical protein
MTPNNPSPRAVYERPQDLTGWTNLIISSLTERNLEDPDEKAVCLNTLKEFEKKLIKSEPSPQMIDLVAKELIKPDGPLRTAESPTLAANALIANVISALKTITILTDNTGEFSHATKYLSDLKESLNKLHKELKTNQATTMPPITQL